MRKAWILREKRKNKYVRGIVQIRGLPSRAGVCIDVALLVGDLCRQGSADTGILRLIPTTCDVDNIAVLTGQGRGSPQGMPADLRVACSREGTHPPRSQSLGVASPETKKFLATLRTGAHLSRNGIPVSPSFVRSMKLTRSPNSFRLPYTVTPYSLARGDVAVRPILCGFDSGRASLQASTAQSLQSL
jgi:hypothetical protein